MHKGSLGPTPVLLVGILVTAAGCGGSGYEGEWEGEIREGDKVIRIRLDLTGDGGTFTIVGGLDRYSDVKMDYPYPIVNVEKEGDTVRFTVVLAGEQDDDDNLAFALKIKDGELEGTFREKHPRARTQPITLNRV